MLPGNQDTIVAIATAPGRGAVGIVRVSGPEIGAIVAALCGRKLKAREATYLPFLAADGEAIDRGLAIHFEAPYSFTGEHVLELQAHGGPIVLQLLLARCLQAAQGKARLARPGEFSERAFLNDKIDLVQAEAVADLIDASTEAAARSASRALAGHYSTEIHQLRDALVRLRVLVEATLDFPEEEIDFLEQANARGQLQAIQGQLQSIAQRARQGALLRDGIRVVIAGQPNVGKSSLLNALAGAELAIVTPVAGTTRDKVEQTIQIEGVPVHVTDTAGLRSSADEVEKIGIERAWGAIAAADVVLFMHDLTRKGIADYEAADRRIAQKLATSQSGHCTVLHLWNKADMAILQGSWSQNTQGSICLSAKSGTGLNTLRDRLLGLAGWQAGAEGVYIARTRHVVALERVQHHVSAATGQVNVKTPALDLMAEDLRQAQNALNEITGEFTPDDLLGVIFSSFCIGK